MEGVLPPSPSMEGCFKTNRSRLTGVNGTVCHYVTVSFAGGGSPKREMRSVGSLFYPPISEMTSSTSYTPWRLQGTWVSIRCYNGLKRGSIGLAAQNKLCERLVLDTRPLCLQGKANLHTPGTLNELQRWRTP